jgi:hypothetical protein
MTELTPDSGPGQATDTGTAARLHRELFRSAPDAEAREQDRPMTGDDTEAAMIRLRTPFDTSRVDVVAPRRSLHSDADGDADGDRDGDGVDRHGPA